MTCPFTPSQLRVLSKPNAIEDAIAAIIADRLEAMRERERQEMCAKVEREGFAEWLRHRDLGMLCGLMFVAVVGVAWVAELKMDGAW